jgi:CHAD domain-containing protein
MALAADRVQKTLEKLRKCLKQLPGDPAPEDVHKLRTLARHIEDIAAAITSPDEKPVRSLLRSIKPIRKTAGRVRDLDVLIGNALTLPRSVHSDSLTRLVESLGMMRRKSAGKLVDTVRHRQKSGRRNIERYRSLVESSAAKENTALSLSIRRRPPEQRADAVAAKILHDLSHGPALHAQGLHRFRLKVKQLRSILQLKTDSEQGLLAALGHAKDAIGDWHDWHQLSELATQSLDAQGDRAPLSQIRSIRERKLKNALTAAHTLRELCGGPRAKIRRAA